MVFQNLKSPSALVIIGPTATGKSALAHTFYSEFERVGRRCEIVNLDAFQIYRGVTAGTAKPSPTEQKQYTYHGIDILEPQARFDAQIYANWARKTCAEILERGAVPLCVGGSGLYLRAFLHGLDPLPIKNEDIRNFLRGCAQAWGNSLLYSWLVALDPVRAMELHPNDKTRVERALELYFLTGNPPSAHRSKMARLCEQPNFFRSFLIHVEKPQDSLRKDIESRTGNLFKMGFIDEVYQLKKLFSSNSKNSEQGSWQSLQAIGYPEVSDFLNQYGIKEALRLSEIESFEFQALKNLISTKTWQYARRQRTWNKKEKCNAIFNSEDHDFAELFAKVQDFLELEKRLDTYVESPVPQKT